MEIFMGGERYFRTLPKSFLGLKRIPYQHLRHPPAFTAGQLAAAEHVPGDMVAKTVIVKADGEFAMAVLPTSRRVKLPTLRGLASRTASAAGDRTRASDLIS